MEGRGRSPENSPGDLEHWGRDATPGTWRDFVRGGYGDGKGLCAELSGSNTLRTPDPRWMKVRDGVGDGWYRSWMWVCGCG